YAPMAGTISRLNKEVGEIALGSQFQEDVIMVISNLSGMEALVDVDENDVVSVSAGDSAKIEVDAFPDVVFDGIVTEIANSANISGQGTADQKTEFEVKVAVLQSFDSGQKTVPAGGQEINTANVNNRLRPGMTAGCDIVTEIRENALSIPIQSVAVRTVEQLTPAKPVGKNDAIADEQPEESAYKPDKDGFVEVVFVVKSDGTVEARQVKTGIQSDTHIEILEGLSENDQIVIGNYRAISKDLQNGTPVTVKDNTAAK
ncbi:MAG: efflux RND transporter periplasmic adaptor subunit, partial [Calditrichaeota bacterium]|nr:efflux RND transporter periplasmic adaptor subunit [Calditrichota bacterium]